MHFWQATNLHTENCPIYSAFFDLAGFFFSGDALTSLASFLPGGVFLFGKMKKRDNWNSVIVVMTTFWNCRYKIQVR